MIDFFLDLNPGLIILAVIIMFIMLVSQIAMYAKAGKPGLSALVPIWNVIVFLEIVGRPKWHSVFLLVPGFVILGTFFFYYPEIDGLFHIWVVPEFGDPYWMPGPTTWDQMVVPLIIFGAMLLPIFIFVAIIFTEICDSFGKHKLSDKIYCIVFNGAYLLFAIGISDQEYEGPWYAKKHDLPYTMPDFKGTNKKKTRTNKPKPEAKPSAKKTTKKKEQSEYVAAMVEKYKKKS